MNEAIGIVLCLFGAIGIAQCICWAANLRKKPGDLRRGYHIVTMYDDPVRLEAQLRYSISRLGWEGCGGETLLLVDMGLGQESMEVCQQFLRGKPGLLLCGEGELVDMIREMDALQGA